MIDVRAGLDRPTVVAYASHDIEGQDGKRSRILFDLPFTANFFSQDNQTF